VILTNLMSIQTLAILFVYYFGIWMRLIFSSLSCKITCHPAFFHKLPTFWAVKSNIQVSNGLTTSRGPGTAYMFALTLAEQLFGESVAREVAEFLVICFVIIEFYAYNRILCIFAIGKK
jgi:hypothetical protein